MSNANTANSALRAGEAGVKEREHHDMGSTTTRQGAGPLLACCREHERQGSAVDRLQSWPGLPGLGGGDTRALGLVTRELWVW